jgi:hypothetical protein
VVVVVVVMVMVMVVVVVVIVLRLNAAAFFARLSCSPSLPRSRFHAQVHAPALAHISKHYCMQLHKRVYLAQQSERFLSGSFGPRFLENLEPPAAWKTHDIFGGNARPSPCR